MLTPGGAALAFALLIATCRAHTRSTYDSAEFKDLGDAPPDAHVAWSIGLALSPTTSETIMVRRGALVLLICAPTPLRSSGSVRATCASNQ